MTRPGIFIIHILFVIAILLSFDVRAGHIVGGDVTSRCLGSGRFEITMKIYRDCNCTGCAGFDPNASIGVYRCGNAIDCRSLGQSGTFASFSVTLGTTTSIPTPDYPCLIPPNVCVEEGVYRFTVFLPPSNENYYIVYQRCCRNETITNIVNPRIVGATFFAEITAASLAACNNSPVFREFPPTVICSNFPLEYDHSAVDADGDSLVYRFCAPLNGGGLLGGPDAPMGDPFVCNGIIPNPGCPPPYNAVTFQSGFSPTNPLGGNPVITIDPATGLISGTPTILGQFVVGVCVDEYRNGQLMGTLRRDFQFNTASCDPNVFADIESDRVIGDQRYSVISCGSNTLTINNRSGVEQFIRQYSWTFPDATPSVLSTRNATITFPDTGTYLGKLIINPGLSCADSADIVVSIYPAIDADFEFDYDTCVAEAVQFTDLSTSGSGQITRWDWDMDNGVRKQVRSHNEFFPDPGVYDVQLKVQDINGCRDSITKKINYFPVPETVIVEPDKDVACTPAGILFLNLSAPIDESYDITWDFGDGNTGKGISPTHVYETPGVYTVSVWIVSPIGCRTSATFPNAINVIPSPRADFSWTPEKLTHVRNTAQFNNLSEDEISWNWMFGMEGTSSLENPSYAFADTGLYEVKLIVTHENGCMDTISKVLDVEPVVTYFVPNAFTSNGDGLNDFFLGKGILDYIDNFKMTIVARWGEEVYTTDDPLAGWNGRHFNSGRLLPEGVYTYLIRYVEPRGREVELKGVLTLLH